MARNYKRDAKGRFARYSANRAARKKRDSETYAVYGRKGSRNVKAYSVTQLKSVKRHTVVGALAGTAVMPGAGTLAGAAVGAGIGNFRKKNRPIIMQAGPRGGRTGNRLRQV